MRRGKFNMCVVSRGVRKGLIGDIIFGPVAVVIP